MRFRDCNDSLIQGSLDRLNAGDADAREGLFTSSLSQLHCLSVGQLRNFPGLHGTITADDVCQDACLRLHQAVMCVCPPTPGAFFALAKIEILRVLLDLLRKQRCRPRSSQFSDGEGVGVSSETEAETAGLTVWTAFHEAVSQLPIEQKEVFDLLWLEELSQTDAAVRLGISLATFERRWAAARHKLCRALKGEGPE